MATDVTTVSVAWQDPRVARTRKLLRDAFLSLLADKGFHAITVQEIAARATVNRATFYAHFLDKYDLLDQMIGEHFRDAIARRVPADSPFTQAGLKTVIVAVFETLAEINDHTNPANRALYPLIEAKAQGEIKAFLLAWLGQLPGVDAVSEWMREVTATVMSSAAVGTGIEWSRSKRTTSPEEVANHIVVLLTNGLSKAMGVQLPPAPR